MISERIASPSVSLYLSPRNSLGCEGRITRTAHDVMDIFCAHADPATTIIRGHDSFKSITLVFVRLYLPTLPRAKRSEERIIDCRMALCYFPGR